jgi:hypothetical protein
VLLRSPVPTPATAPTKGAVDEGPIAYFQLKQASLVVDHCSISRVALAIQGDGSWALSLRADQNPQFGVDIPLVAAGTPRPPRKAVVPQPRPILPGASPTTKHTVHIKRNLFTVTVRAYGAFSDEANLDASPGRPVLFELTPPPFWVQNGIPVFQEFRDKEELIRKYYDFVDRVEVELSYR